jgi:hypothetical protein
MAYTGKQPSEVLQPSKNPILSSNAVRAKNPRVVLHKMSSTSSKDQRPSAQVTNFQFTLFPKLPAEIRLMIWKLALPGPRVVSVTQTKRVTQTKKAKSMIQSLDKRGFRLTYGYGRDCGHIPTILLHICQESRSLALRRFKPFLGSPWDDIPIHFDFKADTLIIDGPLIWEFMTQAGLKSEGRENTGGVLVSADEKYAVEGEGNHDEKAGPVITKKISDGKTWKEELLFLELGDGTCPSHKSLSGFKKLLKIDISRRHTFGFEALVKDHLLQGFKKARRTSDWKDCPVIKFINGSALRNF